MTRRIVHSLIPARADGPARDHSPARRRRRHPAHEAALVALAASVGTLVPFVWFALAFWAMGLLTHTWNLG